MNKFIKTGVFIIAITTLISSACKKEANDAIGQDANAPVTATGVEASNGYRPEILGSIGEPKGIYTPAAIGPALAGFDLIKLYNLPVGDAGTITVEINQKTFIYRVDKGDEVFATAQLALVSNAFPGFDLTINGVDKERNSQITIRYGILSAGGLKELSFRFDGLDAPGKTPSVVEFNNLYSNIGCASVMREVMVSGRFAKVKCAFQGLIGYRAGTWSNKTPMVIAVSCNIDLPKM